MAERVTCENCIVISTTMHKYCKRGECDCSCRQIGMWGGGGPVRGKRPHSYPRPDWNRRLPAGTTRMREELKREHMYNG